MKKNTIDFQQPKWMGFLFLFILNLGVSLNSWGQIEEVPQPMEDAKDIYYSGAISRPTYKDSDPDKFKTNVPGDEITIKVKQEEGSICAGSSSEKVYLEMQVSSIPFSDFTGAEMSQNGDDLKGDLLDDSNLLIVYYREFIKAPTRGDVKSFTFKINECSIDNKIYVRIRNHERRCAVNKFRYSSWRDRTFTIAKSGQFNKGVNTEHEVKCGDEPYDGIVPKFYSLPFNDATSSVSAPQPADNSTIISWYRDYNIGNHNEPTDHHALANTQGAAVFKPSMAYNNDENNPESKKTSFWRYKAQNDCDIDDLSPYANRAGSDLNLPAPPEVKGFAAFIRYDIQGNLDDLFGITEVNLYDTDGLECAEEIK